MQKLFNVQLYDTCSRNLEGFNNLGKQNRTIALKAEYGLIGIMFQTA